MAQIEIQMNRGNGWEVRQAGEMVITADDLAAQLPAYAIQYPHRAMLDGVLVAEVVRPNGNRRGKVVRHDV